MANPQELAITMCCSDDTCGLTSSGIVGPALSWSYAWHCPHGLTNSRTSDPLSFSGFAIALALALRLALALAMSLSLCHSRSVALSLCRLSLSTPSFAATHRGRARGQGSDLGQVYSSCENIIICPAGENNMYCVYYREFIESSGFFTAFLYLKKE